jgi:hypothetical protein
MRRRRSVLHEADREVAEPRSGNAYPLVVPVCATGAIRRTLAMQRDGEPAWIEGFAAVFGEAYELDQRRAVQFRRAAPHVNVVRHSARTVIPRSAERLVLAEESCLLISPAVR